MSPKQSKIKAQTLSSSPKNPNPKRSSGVSKKIILTGIVAFLALVIVACLLDYQQGKLADHTSRLPYEVQEATKYVATLASDLPRNVEVWYEGARGQVVLLAGKMYVGDKTLAQLLFGEDVAEVDNIPENIKKDFEVEDVIEGIKESVRENIVEENTLADLKAAEENAMKLRKEEELRIYEENKQEIKDEALEVIEGEKKAAMNALLEEKAALLEEKAKLRAKIEASIKANTATYEKVLKNQKDELAKIIAGLSAAVEAAEELDATNQDVKLKKQVIEHVDQSVKDASKHDQMVKQAIKDAKKVVGKELYEDYEAE
eukprot:GFUD01040925.1.p1 GENE.GFUD01040925.1~~GFUD01040925.1.p1  ORF type:complete len:316 (-),score=82.30 GFUD01040925.1:76-1023(-)